LAFAFCLPTGLPIYRLEPHDNFDIKSILFNVDVPLFKAPQRQWVGLTDEEIKAVRHSFPSGSIDDLHSFARAILDKSKEKNNA
jgi:hypothetical protein